MRKLSDQLPLATHVLETLSSGRGHLSTTLSFGGETFSKRTVHRICMPTRKLPTTHNDVGLD